MSAAGENATGGGREVTLEAFRDAVANRQYEVLSYRRLGGGRAGLSVRHTDGRYEQIVVTDRLDLSQQGEGS